MYHAVRFSCVGCGRIKIYLPLQTEEEGFSVAAVLIWVNNSLLGAHLCTVLYPPDSRCPRAQNRPQLRITALEESHRSFILSSIQLITQFFKILKQGFQRP